MKLSELLKGVYMSEPPEELADIKIAGIESDSRKIKSGDLFVALVGPKEDGSQFVPKAIEQGAKVIVQHGDDFKTEEKEGVIFLTVPDTRKALEQLLRNFYSDVSKKIKVIGITGTNGKTTITYLLEAIFNTNNLPCGVIGTVNYRYGGKVFEAKNTTPGMVENHALLNDMVNAGCAYCAMEVSSHALDQSRVAGIDFNSAIFTNLTGDHLDYHKTMDSYFEAKTKLFIGLGPTATAVINTDDSYAEKLIKISDRKVKTYSTKNNANYFAKEIKLNASGTNFILACPGGETEINTPLVGLHNVYNILSAIAVAHENGLSIEQIKKGLENLKNVPGRLESVINNKGFAVLVDYAHTDDALANVLSSLRKVVTGKIITVFGCGGDRDKTKRPRMGKVASELSGFSIITSDNPRSEEPEQIAKEIEVGCVNNNYKIILDREDAIKEAIGMAQPDDCILIAGKGHENYQIFKNQTIHFDDKEIAKKYL
jgi:UDP-N-acetylmuramoyl-L-alanyl-D-glutamate--2,6-diaminopimelate ligase